jgi:hypothetical protein
MEQLNFLLRPEANVVEELSSLKEKLDKLRRSFFKRYEVEMDAIKNIEKRLVDLENANSDGKDRIHSSWQADSLECASGH